MIMMKMEKELDEVNDDIDVQKWFERIKLKSI